MDELTVIGLQNALVEELTRLFSEERLPSPKVGRAPLSVFADDLPIPETDDDPDPFPYIIVRPSGGAREAPDEEETAAVNLLFGCYDNGAERQGHCDILHLIERVKRRFFENPVLGAYEQTGRVEWARPEDDPYPYYFGGMQLTFAIPAVTREDGFS